MVRVCRPISLDLTHTSPQTEPEPEHIATLIYGLVRWHRAWAPIQEYVPSHDMVTACSHIHRMGPTVMGTFTITYQTHVFSILPPEFSKGFKELIAYTFELTSPETCPDWLKRLFPSQGRSPRPDLGLWMAFDELGLTERYESLILSVCYEHIEAHIKETCSKVWDQQMLQPMRNWMSDVIIPWLITPYAREARTSEFY